MKSSFSCSIGTVFNNVNNTNVFSCVGSWSHFYFCYSCSFSSIYKVQFPKLTYTSFIVCVVSCVKNEVASSVVVVSLLFFEYCKTGDFILDLYWPGCRCVWPSANTWLTRMSLVQLTEPWPHILYWMCLCYTLVVLLRTILNAKNVVPNLEWSNMFMGYGTVHPSVTLFKLKSSF